MSPPKSIGRRSELINIEPNHPPHLSEDHRHHRCTLNTVSHHAKVSVTLNYIYISPCNAIKCASILYVCFQSLFVFISINVYDTSTQAPKIK